MRVLVCGADGFLGRQIATALASRGHQVVRGVRRPRLPGDVAIDYRRDTAVAAWLPRLERIDGVVNAVGILREREAGDFERIHHRAPAALFAACRQAGVARVVQISALGTAATPYLTSKRAGDAAMPDLLPQGVVLRPGLVFGAEGASTGLFLALASLPLHVRPGGTGPVQPVHVDDVAAAVARLIEGAAVAGPVLDLPGPAVLSYGEWPAAYRAGLGLPPALSLPVPGIAMAALARLAGLLPASLLTADTWAMLKAGNTGCPDAAVSLLGRPLRAVADFIAPAAAEGLRRRALAAWQRPLLRASLAILWLATALVSAGLFPVADSLALLAAFGLAGVPAVLVLAAATAIDGAMGILSLLRPGRRLWLAQLALVVAYSGLVAWRLPEFLLHPFAPILKNLAIVALLLVLYAEEERP